MQVAATLRYARISPQKCRLMADAIRGKNVDEALKTLTFTEEERAHRKESARVGDRQRGTQSRCRH
jgi:ribosomal protein L22